MQITLTLEEIATVRHALHIAAMDNARKAESYAELGIGSISEDFRAENQRIDAIDVRLHAYIFNAQNN